ncbi:hypothetical protein D8674_021670 [Pyrus ussuriensis x Pyrus communis]|uniref:Uncharacterized protein n=1 Tax=Pyrus ussuriensis x Pyrus communis TaxID=2448454 RepID=A0A5N5GN71_9ROSA|nr:hypothetical protein D8674_021670 [Pyrus ussuriensis x Pyrus communis]
MFSQRMEFSKNGLCKGVKDKQARPRWRLIGPTGPVAVGEAQVGVLVSEELLYLRMELGTSRARFALIDKLGTIPANKKREYHLFFWL